MENKENRKIAVVTGASRGIGKAISNKFIEKEWFVIKLDLSDDPDGKGLHHKNCCFISCDVSKEQDTLEVFQSIQQITSGKIDLLVNNAGIIEVGEFEEIPLEAQNRILDVNVKGVINCTYAALPLLKKTPNSQIINLCSASALIGNPELTVYAASKSAVMSLTEGWAMGFKKYGIKVSDVLPMKVRTAMVFNYLGKYKDQDETAVKLIPEDIANAIYRASQKYKIHRSLGPNSSVFAFLTSILPYPVQFSILKKVIKYRE